MDGAIQSPEDESTPESPILLHSNRATSVARLPTMDESICDSFPTLAYIDNLLPESYQKNYSQNSSVLNFNQPLVKKASTFLEEEDTSPNWKTSLTKALKRRLFSKSTLSKTEMISVLVYWGIQASAQDLKSDLYNTVSDVLYVIRKGGSTSYGEVIDQRIRDSISLCSRQVSETFSRPTYHQIKCCKCNKWRKVPTSIALESLSNNWSCPLNTWNRSMAKCSFPQEQQDEALSNARSYSRGDSIVQPRLTEIADEDPPEKMVFNCTIYYMRCSLPNQDT